VDTGVWNSPPPRQQVVDDDFLRTLTGSSRRVVEVVLVLSFLGLWLTVRAFGSGGVFVFFLSGLPVAILAFSWWRLGQGVELGFVASMYLHSTLLGVACSFVGEFLLSLLWTASVPDCELGFTGTGKDAMLISLTEKCEVLGAAAWLGIPGVIEETFKAIWLFYRLRRSDADVPTTCCCGGCWSTSSRDCGRCRF